MADVQKCSIYSCRANSSDRSDLKFFQFPSKGSSLFLTWLTLCKESTELILSQRCPVICSRHFHNQDIYDNELCKNALPSLFLFSGTRRPGFKKIFMSQDKEKKLGIAETETNRTTTDAAELEIGDNSTSCEIKTEINDDDDVEASNKVEDSESKVESTKDEIVTSEIKSECNNDWIELSIRDEVDAASESEDRPTDTKDEIVIDSYQQALELLEPLEDYAMRTERYKAFGLLMTLDTIFKNPKSDSDS